MEFNELKIGMKESIKKLISEEDILQFAEISLDYNPVHLDEKYAEKTIFKKRIAHGMITSSLISAILGTKLPGPGTIYLKQILEFKKPVYINDTITVTCEIINLIKEKRKVILSTIAINQNKEIVLEGEATVIK